MATSMSIELRFNSFDEAGEKMLKDMMREHANIILTQAFLIMQDSKFPPQVKFFGHDFMESEKDFTKEEEGSA
jgi:hypothetical protein